MELFTEVIEKMYAEDPKHEIADPMEHILREMGINPPRKNMDNQEEVRELVDERDSLRHQIRKLENQEAEL